MATETQPDRRSGSAGSGHTPSGVNVVLVEPEIPGNTGNVGRTCVGTQSRLHLVGKLGFSIEDRYLRRAGLDYWKHLDLHVHESWENFMKTLAAQDAHLYFFEKDAKQDFWDARFIPESYLIFGSETRGFPREILEEYSRFFLKIPMTGKVRSLNLSSAVAIALYEAVRQMAGRNAG